MSEVLKIGFLGAGKMATALASGFVATGKLKPQNLIGSDPYPEALQVFKENTGGQITDKNTDVARDADLLFLAVKPDKVADALDSIQRYWRESHCLISIVAGAKLDQLAAHLPAGARILRVMPNTPALVGSSASAFALGEFATRVDAEITTSLLNSVGITEEVREHLLDAVTGLSGSGPAFVYQFIEALSDGGVASGLPRELATKLAAQTVAGAAKMVLETGIHPGQLKDAVTSPGGTTIEGVHELEKGGLRATTMNAVRAAAAKSRKLGRPRSKGRLGKIS
ncbi:MAG TPA: pyrroline-5-carboxylate reductase [Verrucomicrobiales bacterium]|nr:pyrroline-5-carboxylate reductase [Pedosphaera sp.]MBL6842205.1 pyrroline-5-carboxylate reductase [Verrucomicrobiae bacterium]RZO73116.1 MAG: pyrroline-5-carboxylate reductase [Limisphaerales bacterium]HAO67139.1 pyrroline-5-carboxylate reductase [Verrucomicrobiales bacterium]HAQ99536.1 pyrroline-5-carboxylate reductase [Verrucomicrobiales bacterium]|tara:strand:- start:5181 stop:6026 length:846 start_codon:yes stop_codon:yes gene_type:complete